MIVYYLFLSLCISTGYVVLSFNIEDRDPLVKKSPQDSDSYFGFSVALHRTRDIDDPQHVNWILVGAPLGQNLQPGSNYSGALFKCPITKNTGDCEQVKTDGQRLEEFDYGDEESESSLKLKPPGPDEIKTGQWLGVTVKSQKPGGLVMVCAHRYIQSSNISSFHYGQGLCYLLDRDLNAYDSLQYCKGRPVEKLHQQYGFCQIGTSISFVGDDFALVGAPGPYTWRGTVFGQVVVGDYLERDKTIYRGPLNDNPEPIDKYSYLGMSVGGGKFFSKTTRAFFAGAPRSHMVGQVYFFDKNQFNEELNVTLIISGKQFGASFGYEVISVDINSDGYDDLLVGAPFYYEDTKGGAVYIYYNIRQCTNVKCEPDKILHGKVQSRFGFSMTSLGDINKDGFNDVAIGAPYEYDKGAVYIYLGSNSGLSDEPSQVLRIENHKTFGYSLSGGLDMDDNGYPDLLVGAYESNMAILYQTRPIIDIKIHVVDAYKELRNINFTKKGCREDPQNLNNTCFSFRSCFKIMGSIKKLKKININYHISEERKIMSRIWFYDPKFPDKRSSNHNKTLVVDGYSKEYCQNERVYIREGISDILNPINFRIKYSLENEKYHSPILNKTSTKEFTATFQKDCGDNDICESELVLNIGSNLTNNTQGAYMVNMVDEEFILEANVTNKQEPAYQAKMFVSHPPAMSYIALKSSKEYSSNVKCTYKNDTLIICDLGNPLNKNKTLNLKLRFEILKNTKLQKLDLHVFVNSTSLEKSRQTSQSMTVILQKIAEFSIRGKASSNLFYGGELKMESSMKNITDIGARVTHKFEIENTGLWMLPQVQVKILWPLKVSDGKWLLYLESNPLVSGSGVTGICDVQDKESINPLNLALLESDEPENLMLPEDSLSIENETIDELSRKKRSTDYADQPQMLRKKEKKRKIAVLDCANEQSVKCIEIDCYISNLTRGRHADIDIRSRIWNSTLTEDYSNVDWVEIKSFATVYILDPTLNISDKSIQASAAETIAYPGVVVSDSGLNWWIIGAAVLAGLLVLVILIVILYKCGFFKRKRVADDPTLSGNLLLKEENDKLLKTK